MYHEAEAGMCASTPGLQGDLSLRGVIADSSRSSSSAIVLFNVWIISRGGGGDFVAIKKEQKGVLPSGRNAHHGAEGDVRDWASGVAGSRGGRRLGVRAPCERTPNSASDGIGRP